MANVRILAVRAAASAARVAAAAWIAGCAFMYLAQDSILFPAPTDPAGDPATWGAAEFRIERLVTADGLALQFWAARPAPGMPTVIQFHGNGAAGWYGSRYLAPLAREGYGVVLAEYRGYSGNPGAPSEAGLAEDARAYADWTARSWEVRLPFLLGESLGTGVAVSLAAERPVAGLFLDSPYTSIPDVVWAGPYFWAPGVLVRNRFDSLSRIRDVRAPVFVVHGTDDILIPNRLSRRLLAAAPCRAGTLYLPGVPHVALGNDPSGKAVAALRAFLSGGARCLPEPG